MTPRVQSSSVRSEKRASLADQIPRPVKRASGRTNTPQIPANIRVDRVTIDDEDRVYVRRRLGEVLGKHAASIERVSVRVRDINGPRGGVDLLCRIKVVLSTLPSVVVDHQASSFRPAFLAALSSADRAVRRVVQRSRKSPARRER